jgi:hypothetical protein
LAVSNASVSSSTMSEKCKATSRFSDTTCTTSLNCASVNCEDLGLTTERKICARDSEDSNGAFGGDSDGSVKCLCCVDGSEGRR